jgi:hypothetical protein
MSVHFTKNKFNDIYLMEDYHFYQPLPVVFEASLLHHLLQIQMVLRILSFQEKIRIFTNQKAQGPHRSPESYWLNISHINTCKVTFLYCGPNCSGTMTLTT